MSLAIRQAFLPFTDPEASLAFYRDALGFEVRADVGSGPDREITVGPVGQPDVALVLSSPIADALAVVAAMRRAGYGRVVLTTDDLDAVFVRAEAHADAEVIQEPFDLGHGRRACAFLDPCGNVVRIEESPR